MASVSCGSGNTITLDLGTLGTLVHVPAMRAAEWDDAVRLGHALPTTTKHTPRLIFVLDRSGSMGQEVKRICCALVEALKALGVDDIEVTLVMFSSTVAEEKVNSVSALGEEAERVTAWGVTCMAGVVPVVRRVLSEVPEGQAMTLLVVSDGQIDDKDATAAAVRLMADEMRGTLAARLVDVCMVRLLTSMTAEPDTRALACFGSLANTGCDLQLIDIETKATCEGDEKLFALLARDALVEGLKAGMMRMQGAMTSLTLVDDTTTAPLRTGLVGHGVTHVRLSAVSDMWILVQPGVVDPLAKLAIVTPSGEEVGRPWAGKSMTPLTSVAQIKPYLTRQHATLTLAAASGVNAGEVDAALNWVEKLKDMLDTSTRRMESGEQCAAQSVKHRVRAARELQRESAGIITQLLQLRNRGLLASLNAAQLASYLRGDMKSSRTAKRVGDVDTMTSNFMQALQALVAQAPVVADRISARGAVACAGSGTAFVDAMDEPSYYSMDTWTSAFQALRELDGDLANMTIASALPLVGGMGIPVQMTHEDCPDPWMAIVDHVFVGVRLSQSDIAFVKSHDPDAKLYFPGFGHGADAAVNGVVPLQALNPTMYRLYTTTGRAVANVHAGFTIRGSVAPIDYDRLALESAALVKLCQQTLATAVPLQGEEFVCASLRRQIADAFSSYAQGHVLPLVNGLNVTIDSIRCRPVWAPDLQSLAANIVGAHGASPTKLWALLLAARSIMHRDNVDVMKALVGAAYDYDAYNAAKRFFKSDDDNVRREAALQAYWSQWFVAPSIDDDFVGAPGTPDVPPPIVTPLASWCDVLVPTWLPDPRFAAALARRALTPIPPYFDDRLYTENGGLSATPMPKLPEGCEVVTVPPEYKSPLPTPGGVEVWQAFGMSSADGLHLALLAVAMRALQCSKQDHRATVSVYRPALDLTSKESCARYLCAATQGIVDKMHAKALERKRMREANAAADAAAQQLATMSYAEFVDVGLTSVAPLLPTRASTSYALLVSRLTDLASLSSSNDDACMKLWTLATGCAWGSDAVIWGNGLAHDVLSIEKVLREHKSSYAAGLRAIMAKSIARYRDLPNRHRHSNANPSFFKRGYVSVDAMRAAVSADEFEAYAREHNNCCGFVDGVHFGQLAARRFQHVVHSGAFV